jgi:hypothetical protein
MAALRYLSFALYNLDVNPPYYGTCGLWAIQLGFDTKCYMLDFPQVGNMIILVGY